MEECSSLYNLKVRIFQEESMKISYVYRAANMDYNVHCENVHYKNASFDQTFINYIKFQSFLK